MSKLSDFFKNVRERIKIMSTGKKIAFSVLIIGSIVSIIVFGSYLDSSKYGLLYSNLDPADSKMVMDQLTEKKIEYKIKGDAIYVPKAQIDGLRLEFAPNLSGGSKGYELLDSGDQFGMTDEEFKIKKLRAIQGELERTIKTISQIENARVHISPGESTAFLRDKNPGKAVVYVKLKYGAQLTPDNVKSIVALISSGSGENIPQENVQVIDEKANLLTQGLFDDKNNLSGTSVAKQQDIETEFETKLEKALKEMLEPAIGRNKVKVKINADLDFDSKEKTIITYDPNKVELSTNVIKESGETKGDRSSESPVDNNAVNTIVDNNGTSINTREERTDNYAVGKVESKTISAPGEVKRITASVVIDGLLDEPTRADIQSLVANAIGYKQDRGDDITVVGMNFDSQQKQEVADAIDAMNKQAEEERKQQLYRNIALASGGFIVFMTLILFLRRKFKPKKEEKLQTSDGIDVVIGDEIEPKEQVKFASLNLDKEDEKSHIEKEIKKYATEKPEQVAEIIRSWLAEDEG